MITPMPPLLAHLSRECDPLVSALPGQWVDTSSARGHEQFTDSNTRWICSDIAPGACLFSGHIGGGKSSELRRLADRLPSAKTSHGEPVPVFVDLGAYVNRYDASFSQVLLAIVTCVGAELTEPPFSLRLRDAYLHNRLREIAALFGREVKDDALDVYGIVKLQLKEKGKDVAAGQAVQKALQPHEGGLPGAVKTILAAARKQLADKGLGPLVVLVDGLDKIKRIDEREGEDACEYMYVSNSETLTTFGCHVIYTAPVAYLRSGAVGKVAQIYPMSYVLPTIKVVQRNDLTTPFPEGVATLRAMVAKRLPDGRKLDEAFEPEALEFLIRYSGGHARTCMHLVREACLRASGMRIDRKATRDALRPTINLLAGSVDGRTWQHLAAIECESRRNLVGEQSDAFKLLEGLYVLEYVNGESSGVFEDEKPWYAVHPILREMPEFKDAVKALRSKAP